MQAAQAMFCQRQAFPIIKIVRKSQILSGFLYFQKSQMCWKKARIYKPSFIKAKFATLQYCEQYIGNIV